MNQLEITQEYVTYQSQTALVTLAQQVATSRSKTKPAIKQAIQLGTQIRLGLEALNYSAFLTKPQIDEILYLLSQIATINGFPFAPTVTSVALPNILLGVVGPPGIQGPQGVTGGGYPFLVSNISTDQVIDEFPITLCGAAQWIYDVHDNQNKRVEQLVGCWLPDGSQFRDDGGVTIDPEIGNTVGKISFYINYAGGKIQLIAHVTSGTWTVAGSRIQIPVNGNGVILPSSLTNGTIWIGSPANTPAEWAVSGDISLSNSGVANINPGVIVNADINSAAAISLTKLAALAPSLAVVTDINGFLTTSLTTAQQIGWLSNVTSDVQTQINSKLTVSLGAAVTGDILYYNGINWTNFPRGTNGQLLSSTAGTIAWVSGGAGITSTALNNEVMKSNGVNAVSSGMFSSSIADLILGSGAIPGSARNLSVQGSAANINLFIQSKGTGGILFYDDLFTNYFASSKSDFFAGFTNISELQLRSALTSTVGDSLKVSIKTSGSPVAGLGVGIEFQTQTGVGVDKVGSIIRSISTNVGVGTEAFDLAFFNMAGGAPASEKFRFKSTGDFAVNGSVGTAGQFLRSAGAGASPTWASAVTAPAGADTNVQFNNAGVFGGDAGFIYNSIGGYVSVFKTQNAATGFHVVNIQNSVLSETVVSVAANTATGIFKATSSTFTPSGINQTNKVIISAAGDGLNIGTGSGVGTLSLWTNDIERLRIITAGAWGLAGANYGTSGQVITSQGSGAAPIWTTPVDGVPAARLLGINGVSYDLTANRTWQTGYADTGVLTFAGLAPNSATTINIGAATGWIVDNETNPALPTAVFVNYAGAVNVTVPGVGLAQSSYVLINSAGTVVFLTTLPTSAQRKENIWLGKVAHPGASITAVLNEPDFITSPMGFSRDLFQAIGPYINENVYATPNGANLNINITGGAIYGNGINFAGGVANRKTPDKISVGPVVASPFLLRTQTGAGSGPTAIMDAANYDVAGVVTPVGGGTNRSSLRYIFYVPGGGFVVQYGQVAYATLTDAIAAIGRETFVVFPNLPGNSVLVGVIALRHTTVALNNTAFAQFFNADRFGQIIGATAGVSIGTLQAAYNNSVLPQLSITDALGALTVKNSRALDTSAIQLWQNIATTTTAQMTGAGVLSVEGVAAMTTNLPFTTGGIERFRIAASGAFGLSGANYGTSGQIMTSQGSGAAPIWAPPASTPAGVDTQVQYNTGGAFGADASFFYNYALGKLQVGKDQATVTSFTVVNNTNSAGAHGSIIVGGSSTAVSLDALPPAFTTSGIREAGKAVLYTANTIGLNIGTNGSGTVGLYTAGLVRLTVVSGGNVSIGSVISAPALLSLSKIAPTTLTAADSYLLVGQTENAFNSYRIIGFGRISTYSPAYIGYQETNNSGFTSGDLIFGTRVLTTDTQAVERMRILASGNVGIGTTGPTSKLEVAGGQMRISNAGVSSELQLVTSAGTWQAGVNGSGNNGTDNSQYYIYDGAYRLTIQKGTGNVGIATATPEHKLNVTQAVGSSAPNLRLTPQIILKGYGGSSTYHSGIGFSMNEHTAGYWGSGILEVDDSGSYGAGLAFYTSTGAASAVPTEKMRISSGGAVSIGTTNAAALLHVNSTTSASIRIENTAGGAPGLAISRAGTNAGTWTIYMPGSADALAFFNSFAGIDRYFFNNAGTASAISWTSTSDRRMKANIRPLVSGLDAALRISSLVSIYDRMEIDKDGKQTTVAAENQIGFVAQELIKIAPEYVHEPEDQSRMMSIDYAQMVPLLYKAIEELNAEIVKLKSAHV